MDSLSERQQRLDRKHAWASRWLIFPTSLFRTCWNIQLILWVVYNAFSLPLIVCFQIPQHGWLVITDQVIDTVFYVDIILNFVTTYEKKGHLVLDHKQVAWHYATHWFLIDVIAAFPFEVIYGGGVQSNDGRQLEVSLIRGLKCIRLIRLARLFKFLEKIQFVSHFLKLLRLFFGFAVIAHWLACLWFLIGDVGLEMRDPGTGDPAPQGWMIKYAAGSGFDMRTKSVVSSYITCLYWTVTTLLTVGYGDISASTSTEKMFAIAVIVFGALISATIFGNVTMLIESLGRSEAAYREKMESVTYYMLDLALPDSLQKKVRDFYTLLWNRNKAFGGSENILKELPPAFHHEIAGFLNQDLFDKCLVFMDADPVFLRNLAARLKFCVSLPNDDILREEEVADRMFFIRKGSVQVMSEAHGKLTVMKEGGYFGEIGLLLHQFQEEFGEAAAAVAEAIAEAAEKEKTKGAEVAALAAAMEWHKAKQLGLPPPQAAFDAAAGAALAGAAQSAAAAAAAATAAAAAASMSFNKRTASVQSLVNCDLYFLTESDFSALLGHFPQYHRLLLLIALLRYKQREYHDDEHIIQQMFVWQVQRGELRLKYHKKGDKLQAAGGGTGTKHGSIGGGGAPGGGGKKKREGKSEAVFHESTKDLIRRISILGLTRSQQEAFAAKQRTMDASSAAHQDSEEQSSAETETDNAASPPLSPTIAIMPTTAATTTTTTTTTTGEKKLSPAAAGDSGSGDSPSPLLLPMREASAGGSAPSKPHRGSGSRRAAGSGSVPSFDMIPEEPHDAPNTGTIVQQPYATGRFSGSTASGLVRPDSTSNSDSEPSSESNSPSASPSIEQSISASSRGGLPLSPVMHAPASRLAAPFAQRNKQTTWAAPASASAAPSSAAAPSSRAPAAAAASSSPSGADSGSAHFVYGQALPSSPSPDPAHPFGAGAAAADVGTGSLIVADSGRSEGHERSSHRAEGTARVQRGSASSNAYRSGQSSSSSSAIFDSPPLQLSQSYRRSGAADDEPSATDGTRAAIPLLSSAGDDDSSSTYHYARRAPPATAISVSRPRWTASPTASPSLRPQPQSYAPPASAMASTPEVARVRAPLVVSNPAPLSPQLQPMPVQPRPAATTTAPASASFVPIPRLYQRAASVNAAAAAAAAAAGPASPVSPGSRGSPPVRRALSSVRTPPALASPIASPASAAAGGATSPTGAAAAALSSPVSARPPTLRDLMRASSVSARTPLNRAPSSSAASGSASSPLSPLRVGPSSPSASPLLSPASVAAPAASPASGSVLAPGSSFRIQLQPRTRMRGTPQAEATTTATAASTLPPLPPLPQP